MTRRVKKIDLNKFRNSLTTAIKNVMDDTFLPDTVLPEVEKVVRSAFEKTVNSWEGGVGALNIDPSITSYIEESKPELILETERTTFGATITAYVDSYIWNLLDQGREDRVTKKREKFVSRKTQRTVPGTLDVSGDRSYNEVVYVPEGTKIKGFKARGWSELIEEEVQKELGSKYPNISFEFTLKEKDIG